MISLLFFLCGSTDVRLIQHETFVSFPALSNSHFLIIRVASEQTDIGDPALLIMGYFIMFPLLWKFVFWTNYDSF